jgi:hypothetical protein
MTGVDAGQGLRSEPPRALFQSTEAAGIAVTRSLALFPGFA